MMKQRDADVYLRSEDYITGKPISNIAVHAQLENFVNKTDDERLDELTNIVQINIKLKTYKCTMFGHDIDISLLGVLECNPPIYS